MDQISVLPQVVVQVGGNRLPGELARGLTAVRVQQGLSMPSLCELTFSDPPALLGGAVGIEPGVDLRVLVQGQDEPLFEGEVTALEHVYELSHGRTLRVRGYDRLYRLRKRQTVRAHVQVTIADLAREMGDDLGLKIQPITTGPRWQRLFQTRQSDFELLVEIAERSGLYLTLRGSVLHIVTLEGIGEPLSLILGNSLHEAVIEVNADPAYHSVSATGWDPGHVEVHRGRATRARSGRQIAGSASINGASGDKRELVNEATADDSQADALAQAELDWRVGREVTFWGVAEGNTRLRPATLIQVTGVEAGLEGSYVLTRVTHTIDERTGFLSELSTRPPEPRASNPSTIVVPGVVTRVDDPENLARVKVALPTYGNSETEWLAVLSTAAGAGKGLVMLPDIGDQVLVLCGHNDPGEGIVLGGLYGAKGPKDSGVEGDGIYRYSLLTRGGHRLEFDDKQHRIKLEDSTGNFFEFSPDRLQVHAVVDLEIEAPGHGLTLRGKSIDFVRG